MYMYRASYVNVRNICVSHTKKYSRIHRILDIRLRGCHKTNIKETAYFQLYISKNDTRNNRSTIENKI